MTSSGRVFIALGPLLILAFSLAHAQPTDSSPFDSRAAWDPTFLSSPVNQHRTGGGHPGPSFWQNHVQYTIEATLDTTKQYIRGSVDLTYKNHSPTPLHSIWLRVAPPVPNGKRSHSQDRHFRIENVTVKKKGQTTTPETHRTDTRLQVRLDQPVSANGGTTSLSLDYALSIAPEGLPSRAFTRSGVIYEIAHWFPRVSAYDDQHGWGRPSTQTTDDIHAEYGSFDYHITVPASMIVAGSGTLMNPGEVLTGDQQRRLLQAREGDTKVAVISPDNAGSRDTRPKNSGTLTWHFQMNGVREVAWAASTSFVWNAARIKRSKRRPILAMSYYPPSSVGGEAWNRSTYHVRRAVRFYSDKLYTYPWNTAINVAGPVGNRGFPGLSVCHHSNSGYSLFSCTAQMQGKNWFPVMISPNENWNPWLTDGLGTTLSILAHRQLYDGEFSPKRDEYYPTDGNNPAEEIRPLLTDEETFPIMTPPSFLKPERRMRLYSFKAAFGFMLLRDYILGADQFEYALRQFANRWTFRQPTPSDFFRTMNDATGRDLSWFWKGWFAKTWTIDQGIASVEYVDGNPENGALITLELLRKLPMPVELKVVKADGTNQQVRRPVDIWKRGSPQTVRVSTDSRLSKVVLDPNDQLPDVNSSNDTWRPKTSDTASKSQ